MRQYTLPLSALLISLTLLSACSTPGQAGSNHATESSLAGENIDTPREGDPDYDIVFPQDAVNEVTIQITPGNWQIMLDDMTENYGEQGTGGGIKPGQGAGMPPRGEMPALPEGDLEGQPPQGEIPDFPEGDGERQFPRGANPQFEGGGFLGGTDDSNPVWVEAEISFEGESWEHVGIRFKGNSSLRSTWSSGSLKLPFKLDFDQYEDEYPETEDQRFFGFKQLTFSSNFHDDSYLREKVTADLFREAGVPSAQTAFYAVSIDYGEGPVYLGLYTAVEVVDDTLIETQFSDDSGNVYKPEGSGATFAAGSFTEASFDKETNQDEDDYSDILALFDSLHADTRTTDPDTWRQELEAVFDVDTFLNWLAVNTLVQNWDTYGGMNHNYYLYNNPETGQLVWIPWDNNEALKSGGGMMRSSLTLGLGEVGKNWPLINYLIDDPVYYQKYLSYLESFLENLFVPEKMAEVYQYYHDLISPYVVDEMAEYTLVQSPEAFERSVSVLIQHARQRNTEAEAFLADQ